MKFEKKVEKRVNDHLNQFVKNPYEKRRMTFPLWSKIAIPSAALALTAGIILGVSFSLPKETVLPSVQPGVSQPPISTPIPEPISTQIPEPTPDPQPTRELNALVRPNVEHEVMASEHRVTMSLKSYSSYMAFAAKFVPAMMGENTEGQEIDMSVSIPDAYLALAITGIISSPLVMEEVLSYLELDSEEELKTAAHEVITNLCVLEKDNYGLVDGGFNTNSIWFDPELVELVEEKDEQLYQDLADIFGAAVFMEPCTTDAATQYLRECAIDNMPIPDIALDDDEKHPATIMSSYTCVSRFDSYTIEYLKEQYESGEHKMPYGTGSNRKLVDYIKDRTEGAYIYEGNGFHGADMEIGMSCAKFFLPDDVNATATSILDDVIRKEYSYVTETNNGKEVLKKYNLTIMAPYFEINNSLMLKDGLNEPFHTAHNYGGFASRMAHLINPNPLVVEKILQFSKVKFDYNGFFSGSATFVSGAEGAAPPEERPLYTLSLDHPYVFEYVDNVKMENGSFVEVPKVIGRIVDPVY